MFWKVKIIPDIAYLNKYTFQTKEKNKQRLSFLKYDL